MIADRVGRAHRMFKKAIVHTHPAPARQDAPLRGQGHSEVRDAKNMNVTVADGRESVSAQCLGGES